MRGHGQAIGVPFEAVFGVVFEEGWRERLRDRNPKEFS
jgi:hypothetical protein